MKNLTTSHGYFPIKAPYTIGPDLKKLPKDSLFFHFDEHYYHYISNKHLCRTAFEKYYNNAMSTETESDVCNYLIKLLVTQYPKYFTYESNFLRCRKTEIQLPFDENGYYRKDQTNLPYVSGFDAMASQVQEDIAIVSSDGIAALHVCAPNYWSPNEKVNGNFISIHEPVTNFEKMAERDAQLVKAMIDKGPFERFAWGLTTDTRLNHHLEVPKNFNTKEWYGRNYGDANLSLYLRIERQITIPHPTKNVGIFLIRTYFTDCDSLSEEQQQIVADSIASMDKATLEYKGIRNLSKIYQHLLK